MTALTSDHSSNNVAEFLAPGPGERLRAARLAMGLDIAKIASELHLTGPVIEALEAGDYRDIGARVFVRGYLGNYARTVGVPTEPILRQFDEKWPDEDVRHNMVRQTPMLPADGGPGRGLAAAFGWLVVAGLLILFFMWWRGYLDETTLEPVGSDVVEQMDSTVSSEGGVIPDFLTPDTGDGSLRLPPPPADNPPELELLPKAAPPTPTAPLPETTGLAGISAESPTGLAPAIPAPMVSGLDDRPLADDAAPVTGGAGQITMAFNAPCWVDVRDSERKFKLFGEMAKGTYKVLGGQPPYKLVIGNARAVTITVDGKPFDLSRYAKGNVARFTLDP